MEKKMEEKKQNFSFITGKSRILKNVYIYVSIFKSILFGEKNKKNDILLYKHQTKHR